MNDSTHRKFAAAALSIDHKIPLSVREIEAIVKTSGLEQFSQKAGVHAAELVETAELLSRLGKGGKANEQKKPVQNRQRKTGNISRAVHRHTK